MPLKIVFLDVDGVLNSDQTTRSTATGWTFVGSREVKRLKDILDATGAKVVLSSDWRYDRDDPSNTDFWELQTELLRYGISFYDYTPELPSAHRGAEIDLWLRNHPDVQNFVILDDRTDIEPNKSHWVQTVMARGLGRPEAEEAIRILNNETLL